MNSAWDKSNVSSSIANIVSYLPVALYAESLRLSSTIVLAASSRRIFLPPVTGCIKDVERLWNLSMQQLFSDFKPGQYVVASLRHGNTWPLCNSSLLTRSGLIGRSQDTVEISEHLHRPTTLHLSYLCAQPRGSDWTQEYVAQLAHLLTCLLLAATSGLLLWQGLWIGASALLCILINLVLFCIIQNYAGLYFADKQKIENDMRSTAANGAPIDIQVVAENWNASELDVLVGYSSQLHALTNIPVRVKNWKAVKYITRCVVVVSTVQAAILASLVSRSDQQVWGSLFWLACYLMLGVPTTIILRREPALLFDAQPLSINKVPPLMFKSRRTALAFIASLPVTLSKSDRWDWLDVFFPPNARRTQWQTDLITAGLDIEADDLEHASAEVDNAEVSALIRDVRAARQNGDFARISADFLNEVKYRRR